MLYCLDTNICISCMRKTINAEAIIHQFMLNGYFNIKVPSVVVAELMHGAFKSKIAGLTMQETLDFLSDFEIVPFDYDAAVSYGKIKASLERVGKVIGPNDLLIAATALSHNATLGTNNTQEFSRIDSLKLSDYWTI